MPNKQENSRQTDGYVGLLVNDVWLVAPAARTGQLMKRLAVAAQLLL